MALGVKLMAFSKCRALFVPPTAPPADNDNKQRGGSSGSGAPSRARHIRGRLTPTTGLV